MSSQRSPMPLETEGHRLTFPYSGDGSPLALSGQDVIGQARTGTGKTYAFGVAMLQSVGKPRKNRKKPRGLVLVPTRELALQVSRGSRPRRREARLPHPDRLRRARLRAPGRGAEERCRRDRRHPWPAARPRSSRSTSTSARSPLPGARRGRPHARSGLPARHRAHHRDWSRRSGRPCSSRPPCRVRSWRSRGAT